MKKNAMRINLRRAIFRSLGRYIAIVMIIALGSSIFVGLRMTKTDMVATGQRYMDQQNMFDLRLISSYGWGKEQLDAIRALEGVSDAEGVYYIDLIAGSEEQHEESVYRVHAMPQSIDTLVLQEGRMPQAPNECLASARSTNKKMLGKDLTISQDNSEDALDVLNETTFTIVGLVNSPLYMDVNLGSTSVGSGQLAGFLYIPREAFNTDYYTEIHLTIPGDYAVYSSAYADAVADASDKLEPALQDLAQQRFQQVRQEAEDTYADGARQYQDGLTEYYDAVRQVKQELQEAYDTLIESEQTLKDSEQKLIDGEQAIKDAEEQLKQSRETLQSSRQTLADAKANAYAQIAEASDTLFDNYQTVTKNLQELDNGLLELNAGLIQLNAGITQLETGIAQLDSGISQLELLIEIIDTSIEVTEQALDFALEQALVDEETVEKLREKLEDLEAERDGYQQQLEELRTQREECATQLDDLYDQQLELEAQRDTLEDSRVLLQDALASIESGYAQLTSQQISMENKFAAAEAQITAGEARIEDGEAQLQTQKQQLQEGWEALEEGKKELAQGWVDYRQGKDEAEQELADAKTELDDALIQLCDAREAIDAMTSTSLHILNRTSNQGYNSLESNSDIVAGVSRVLPAFFLLVAALVCITTMTRMVEEERTQIGTLKALGYSNTAIAGKYLLYAGSSAILGCGLGTLAGSVVFPIILWRTYQLLLLIPGAICLTFDLWLCLLVVFAYALVELGVTWYCCSRSMREVPAELIRPKAPEAGKSLIFEKLRLWKRIGFLNKVTIRNIFRYRQRLAMMLVGIGGCTALLLTSFGLKDSIFNIVTFQYEDITDYDMEVYFSDGRSEEDQLAFRQSLADSVEDTLFFHQTSVELCTKEKTQDVSMIVSTEEIMNFYDFHRGSEQLAMPGVNEALLSVGAAQAMGISSGDTVTIRNSDMETLELTVTGIFDNYIYNYIILLPQTVEDQWGRTPEQQMAYVQVLPEQDVHLASTEIAGQDGVMNVNVMQDMAEMVGSMMQAMDLLVVVVSICAAMLGATVLYNLTNININERIREIATIKVLGFNASETAMYIFKENLALSAMGTAVGLVLGELLLAFVMSQIQINFVWFQSRILPPSYLWAVILTMLTAVLVDFVFFFRLEKINMAEALKSVE